MCFCRNHVSAKAKDDDAAVETEEDAESPSGSTKLADDVTADTAADVGAATEKVRYSADHILTPPTLVNAALLDPTRLK